MSSTNTPVALVKYDGTLNALRKAIELCNSSERSCKDKP